MSYNDLNDSAKLVTTKMVEVMREDGPGYTSPAWSKLWRMQRYLAEQARMAMEGVTNE